MAGHLPKTLFCCGFAALLAACGKPAPRPPNVILITVDTVRADHLACHGYPRNTMPFVERLVKDAVLFTNAYSTASWTAPSVASIATALYPREHGVLHGTVTEGKIERQETLDPSFLTLAEAMKAGGYSTFGVFSNGHMTREMGFGQGFDVIRSLWFEKSPAPNRAVAEIRSRIRESQPYFLWVHYFDPHAPYMAREPWINVYSTNAALCRQLSGLGFQDLKNTRNTIRENPAALQALIDVYDSELGYADRSVEELFGMLEIGEDCLVVVSSDHGEQFLEHNGLYHGFTLYEPEVRVPLIVRMPARRFAGTTVAAPVSNRNILPTILDICGIRLDAMIPGYSLLPLIHGGPAPEPVYLELDRGNDWKGVRRDHWKLLCRKKSEYELFDLASDPAEANPAALRSPEKADELKTLLNSWLRAHPVFSSQKGPANLSRDQKETLRSLGYLK